VAINWHISDASGVAQVFFEWLESGGPIIKKPPMRRGFGTRVLNNIVAISLGGKAHTDYRPDGLHWHVTWDLKTP
ncbi:MAG TPA: hypothetical protein VII21_05810, partial [Aestuariivirga sp.]